MSTEDTKEATERREPKKPKFISYLWDTFDKPPAERRLLTKLDTALISFGAVGYFVKSIDQYNINNAFVSGIPLGLWVICWGRFQAILFSVGHGQDTGYRALSAMGQMASGYIMGGVYHIGGVGGYRGWQWAFIINGSISLPMAVMGYFILPDVPEITQSWYLSEEEIKLAQLRMIMEGRKPRSKYLRHSTDPRYSIPQINNYPTTTSGVQILMTIIYAWLSDTVLRGRRWPPLVFGGVVNIICYVSLAIWDIPAWWKWTCLISAGASFGLSGLCMAWANEVCGNDSEERAITIAAMNEIAYILQIWLPLLVWQQVDAPRYFKGYVTVSAMSVIFITMCFVVRNLHNKESSAARIAQEHTTQSCIQLQQQHERMVEGEKNGSGSNIQLSRFKSVETSSSGQYDSEAISPSNDISPYDEEKGLVSRRLYVQSPNESGDIKGIEAQPSRLL
uniref:Pantothenate transporter liz1 n=2 Tax=Talaromyces marneffei PM1 TaxID=1077442 RepID=A0A093V4C8_TALMA